jgi:trans-2,3-dihydro-3-hydroxyanthranilate isomerase
MMAAAVIPVLDSWAGRTRVHRYFVCDVFTSRPLAGNQLGVFVDGRAFSPDGMQRLARELNYAETVFLLPPENGGDVRMRIFTPSPPELLFAGHPVLGTAFVVGEALDTEAVALETGLGVVRVELERDSGRIVFGTMSQPTPTWEPFESERQLLAVCDCPRAVAGPNRISRGRRRCGDRRAGPVPDRDRLNGACAI